MTDLSLTIAPKSDQLNADDLINGPRTVIITKVAANPSGADQPISISFEGDGGKPYRPCKIMRRLLVMVWGKDGTAYTGRSMTLYRDPAVLWGGIAVGGIRISHMSHLESQMTVALAESKKVRKPYTVKPLTTRPAAAPAPTLKSFADTAFAALNAVSSDPPKWLEELKRQTELAPALDDVAAVRAIPGVRAAEQKAPQHIRDQIAAMFDAAGKRLAAPATEEDDGWPGPITGATTPADAA